jgi:hypothetical protein
MNMKNNITLKDYLILSLCYFSVFSFKKIFSVLTVVYHLVMDIPYKYFSTTL